MGVVGLSVEALLMTKTQGVTYNAALLFDYSLLLLFVTPLSQSKFYWSAPLAIKLPLLLQLYIAALH